jgi:hypothetical protein
MKKYLIGLLAAGLLAGCRNFVEIPQPNVRTFKYTTDYRYVLNNNAGLEPLYSSPLLSNDDIDITDPTRQNTLSDIQVNTYTWAAKYTSDTQGDIDWERLYQTIYTCNEVILGVMDSQGGTDAEKQRLYAEALVHRACAYFTLVNLYGKQYDASTASTDLGVPLLLTPDLFAPLNRASVATVYAQLMKDLKYAVPRLPALPDYNVRPAKVSAYALLARTALHMRDFPTARAYADSALTLQSGLLDLKTYATAPGTIPRRLLDPEVILSKVTVNMNSYTALPLSADVLNLLGTTDLRYTLFTNSRGGFGNQLSTAFTGRAYWRHTLNGEFTIQMGPTVPEVMLIKAECLARGGDATGALTLVNTLRRNRFTTATYTPLTAASAAAALGVVIDEKRREFFGTGARWFDQRRLNADPAFAATETRVFKGTTYTLAPGSPRYVYPIGDKYILLSPELAQNPR